MRRSILIALILGTACLALSSPSSAGVCVEIDVERDSLTEQEQHGAVVILSSLLQEKGEAVGVGECDAIYRVYHLIFGQAVTVMLTGPQGSRQATVNALEELPAIYSQLVNALLDEVPVANSNSTINRRNVTASQRERPKRVDAEKIWFARLGGTGISGADAGVAHSYGFGFRYELDTMGVELSFANLAHLSGSNGEGGGVGSVFKLLGQYYFDPVANSTTYLGAGCSWGFQDIQQDNRVYEGSGVQFEAVAGYEMLRASTIRLFLEAGVSLPFYNAESTDYGSWQNDYADATTDEFWAPSFTLSMGIGFGGGSSRHDRGFVPRRHR